MNKAAGYVAIGFGAGFLTCAMMASRNTKKLIMAQHTSSWVIQELAKEVSPETLQRVGDRLQTDLMAIEEGLI